MDSTPTETHATPHRAHPTRATYLQVFQWLAIFTVIELALSFVPINEIKIPGLVFFAVLKASLVVMFYMHLRYDRWVYTVILLTGVFFALLVGRFLPLMLLARPPGG
jgi:cytochrome c oxidase subunit 4